MEAGGKAAEWMTMDDINPVSLPIKKILLATDGSASSVRATKFCIGMAKKCNAEILAVYVSGQDDNWELPSELEGEKFFGGVHPCEAGLAVAKAFGEKNGVTVNTTILRGSVPRNIVKAAVADQVDMIVLGDSGRTGLSRISIGTVAESVMRLSPCPVLIVREDSGTNP
ncbi:MAG: universal stress protein [Eubacteriales bacterium]